MFENHNLLYFLLCLIPIAIYSIVMFKIAPKQSVKLKVMFGYIILGFLSVEFLNSIQFIFPNLYQHIEYNLSVIDFGDNNIKIKKTPTTWAIFVFSFFQVAFFEEICKWLSFKIGNSIRGKRKVFKESYLSTMFYSTMISAGFALLENIHYISRALWGDLLGSDPINLIIIRSINSVLVHMICGMFMGYFIALSKNSLKIFKRSIFFILSLLVSIVFHGMYDFNLMKPNLTMDEFIQVFGLDFHITNNILISFGIITSIIMGNHLSRLSKKKDILR